MRQKSWWSAPVRPHLLVVAMFLPVVAGAAAAAGSSPTPVSTFAYVLVVASLVAAPVLVYGIRVLRRRQAADGGRSRTRSSGAKKKSSGTVIGTSPN